KAIKTLEAQCKRTTEDRVFQETQVFVGTAKFMAPNLAMLYLQKKDKPEVYEKYVITGTFLYQFLPNKTPPTLFVQPLNPSRPGQVADDSFLSLLFGMRAEEAKRRYDLKLSKEDTYYHYVDVLPRLAEDKVDFSRARLVLDKDTFLPRQLWF